MSPLGPQRETVTLPFGHRWHLEVAPGTYLLLERREPPRPASGFRPAQRAGRSRPAEVIDIDLLALEQGWDAGIVLSLACAGQLLGALLGARVVDAAGWQVEPGWLTLRDRQLSCQLELTPAVRGALIRRLQTVLAAP